MDRGHQETPDADTAGKICVITGANSGIGYEATLGMVRAGVRVVMVCRNRQRGEAAHERIVRAAEGAQVELLIADLASLRQVRALASDLTAAHRKIDVLVNNAGVYRSRPEMSEDGFEKTMAINHLAHFLLTNLLLSTLRAGRARIITITSGSHRLAKLKRKPLEQIIRSVGGYSGVQAYADSKLANLLFSFELARRESDLTAIALHPGVLSTRIWNQNTNLLSLTMCLVKPFMERPARGGERIVRLATVPEFVGATGKFYDRDREARATPTAYEQELATQLWVLSEELTGLASVPRATKL
jgi:NAD(P)-dependent dehydrogenase (short-subunit alcohol dehydrogenase family)